jgi:hypothetical protein
VSRKLRKKGGKMKKIRSALLLVVVVSIMFFVAGYTKAENNCKTITVRYVCGVEQKCQKVKIMDSLTTYHYDTVCVDVEKYCFETLEECK